MTRRNRHKAKSIVTKSTELALAVPQVVADRLTRMVRRPALAKLRQSHFLR